ncbi:MAG: type II toxin-antitoxin system RelE/ParE family toxin [Spirochaetales bacterium]|nr:type II toxin-antitoxin system RelE/ParE family toxin [Spirochaetales bacterium]
MSDIQVLMTPTFRKSLKKMHKNQQNEVKKEIKKIVDDPEIGEEKKGDLSRIFVHKFKIDQQLTLLAYQFDPETRILLMLGSHQNFYKNLKRVVN